MATPSDSMADAWPALRFQSWQSAPDVSFWQKLAALKLNAFQLNDQAQDVTGYFSPGRSTTVPSRLTVDDSAFTEGAATSDRVRYEWTAPGMIFNTNTLEDFKTLDKNQVLRTTADRVLDTIDAVASGADMHGLDALNSFVMVTFADLKKHSFLYWFGFPAVVAPEGFRAKPPVSATSVFSSAQQASITRALLSLRLMNADGSVPVGNFPAFFVIQRQANTPHTEGDDATSKNAIRVLNFQSWRLQAETADASSTWGESIFGFVDPCPLSDHPGWPLRNYLALLSALPATLLPRERSLLVLSFREHVRQTYSATGEEATQETEDALKWTTASLVWEVATGAGFAFQRDTVKVVGWEANARGKMGPRIMELGGILDPLRLAEQSVDLNLKLMLWRQLPSLKLDVLASTRCLLLGAGTLGCYTARSLLAWGFRNFTLVDNSVVSHSNPVRQPLFEFQDVGKPKADCAAKALKRIFPLVETRAVHLSIPMAGHALSSEQLRTEAANALRDLNELIDSHDVIFLGTDSRESRWLPTVMCAAKKKLLLNAALGFDSYLVMRHGVGSGSSARPSAMSSSVSDVSRSPAPLGCYFCNDIVSPRDSLKDRTLDQMCTVTRPGLAPIAAATAVELLVSVLHSPDGVHTTAEKPTDASVPLGYVPHQLRGFLNSFGTMVITGEAFDKCIACSPAVVDAYQADALALLQRACDSNTYLEELTGLHQLGAAADSFMDELEAGDDSDDSDALL